MQATTTRRDPARHDTTVPIFSVHHLSNPSAPPLHLSSCHPPFTFSDDNDNDNDNDNDDDDGPQRKHTKSQISGCSDDEGNEGNDDEGNEGNDDDDNDDDNDNDDNDDGNVTTTSVRPEVSRTTSNATNSRLRIYSYRRDIVRIHVSITDITIHQL